MGLEAYANDLQLSQTLRSGQSLSFLLVNFAVFKYSISAIEGLSQSLSSHNFISTVQEAKLSVPIILLALCRRPNKQKYEKGNLDLTADVCRQYLCK